MIIMQFSSYCQNECMDKILQDAKVLEKNNRQLSTGTGFLLNDDGIIITNKHVVGGANEKITVTFQLNNKIITKEAQFVYGTMDHDLAIIKIEMSGLGIRGMLPYGVDIREPKLGEQISVLGYPMPGIMGQSIKLTNGTVSSINGFMDDKNQFQISAPIQPGNSGSPIIDKYGNVIGIAVSSLRTGQNVNYALKSKLIAAFQLDKVTSKKKVMPPLNLLQKYICLIAIETDKTYYPELKFREGNFNIIQPTFFDTVVSNDNPCKNSSISQLMAIENEMINDKKYNLQMDKILSNRYARAVFETYKLNSGWNGYGAYSKINVLLDIGAYDNIIEEVEELNPEAISNDNKWRYYGTTFIPYAYAKLYKLKFEPNSYAIQKLITEANKAIQIITEMLKYPEKEDQCKIDLSEYYRILAGLYLILEDKTNVSKNYQLALKFNPENTDKNIESFIKKGN